MRFEIGDEVRAGTRVGTVTEVGTVLIQVTTTEGTSRVVCPWEIVRVRARTPGATATSCRGETRRTR